MNIQMCRGDSRTFELTVTDENGVVDLDGAEIRFTVKRSYVDPDSEAIIQKATANVDGGGDEQILITDAPNGEAEIYLVPADTIGLEIPSYDLYQDVQVTMPSGKVYTVQQGTFRLIADITQAY